MTDNEDPRFGERPYIETPEVKDDVDRNGLICFMNHSRECASDCMAYLPYIPENEGKDGKPRFELGEQSLSCALLVNMERAGKHVVILASMLHQGIGVARELIQLRKKTEADVARTAQQPPPNPMGG